MRVMLNMIGFGILIWPSTCEIVRYKAGQISRRHLTQKNTRTLITCLETWLYLYLARSPSPNNRILRSLSTFPSPCMHGALLRMTSRKRLRNLFQISIWEFSAPQCFPGLYCISLAPTRWYVEDPKKKGITCIQSFLTPNIPGLEERRLNLS